MAKKRPQVNNGEIGGYVRKSHVIFPDDCRSVAARKAYIDDLVRLRMSELITDAERDGNVITRWYVDMDISGLGEFLEKRIEFDKAREDAKAGKIRILYARDLARLFRDLIQQEHWFGEMEMAGCEPKVADLPFVADPATRVLIRQQIGSINQYIASRTSSVIKANFREKLRNHHWTGRVDNVFGLRYNKETKGFDIDPRSADSAQFVFEAFIRCQGNAFATIKELERAVREGHPSATLSPAGKVWRTKTLLNIIRNPVYRRMGTCGELKEYIPELIPELIPAETIEEVDRILEMRAPAWSEFAERQKAGRLDYTYGPIMRCGYCGGRMRAKQYPVRTEDRRVLEDGTRLPRNISWYCQDAYGRMRMERVCPGACSLQQFRVDRLVGRAIRQAAGDASILHNVRARSRKVSQKNSAEKRLQDLADERDRLNWQFQRGFLASRDEYAEKMDALINEEQRIRAAMEQEGNAEPEAPLITFTPSDYHAMTRVIDALFPVDDERVNYPLWQPKHTFLKKLGVRIQVKVLPGEPVERKENNERIYGGLGQLVVEIRELGIVGPHAITVTETEEDLRAYRIWRARGIRNV